MACPRLFFLHNRTRHPKHAFIRAQATQLTSTNYDCSLLPTELLLILLRRARSHFFRTHWHARLDRFLQKYQENALALSLGSTLYVDSPHHMHRWHFVPVQVVSGKTRDRSGDWSAPMTARAMLAF